MVRYETLLLTVPEITADEAKSIETQLDKTVSGKKGTMISFDRWGKYRLAFPVNKNEYGVYFLARFEGSDITELIEEVKTLLAVKLHDVVMRHMLTKLEEHKSLEYQRPQSLEEAPSKDVDSLFRDTKSDSSMSDDSDESDEE